MKRTILSTSFGLAIALALGFGATQALAAPAVSAAGRTCVAEECNAYCLMQPCGGEGRCRSGNCMCLYYACATES
jgi:hypothetical protein